MKNPLTKSSLVSIVISAFALTLIAGTITCVLAITNNLTKDTIATHLAEKENAARLEVITADTFEPKNLQHNGATVVYYEALQNKQTVGYVFTTNTPGKSAGIVTMTGINTQGIITGVAITNDKETAGYVEKVTKAGFLEQFSQKENTTFQLGTNIDAVAQATKTSKGIMIGVNLACEYYNLVKGGAGK